jgi:hypothetical protein
VHKKNLGAVNPEPGTDQFWYEILQRNKKIRNKQLREIEFLIDHYLDLFYGKKPIYKHQIRYFNDRNQANSIICVGGRR